MEDETPTEEEAFQEWKDDPTRLSEPVPRLSADEKEEIALGMIQKRYFFVQDIPDEDMQLLPQIFMLVGLAGIPYNPATIGTIYAPLSAAGGLSINGYPTFFEHRFVHKEDWKDILDSYELKAKAVGLL